MIAAQKHQLHSQTVLITKHSGVHVKHGSKEYKK